MGGQGTHPPPRRCPCRSLRRWIWRYRTRCPAPAPGHRPCGSRPLRSRLSRSRRTRPCPPACAVTAGTGRTIPAAAWGWPGLLPRQWWPASWDACRFAGWSAYWTAHRGLRRSRRWPRRRSGPANRPEADDGRRHHAPGPGRTGLPESGRTRQTGEGASWEHSW